MKKLKGINNLPRETLPPKSTVRTDESLNGKESALTIVDTAPSIEGSNIIIVQLTISNI